MEIFEFEKLVRKAQEELPEKIKGKIENVAILVENNPTIEQLKKTGTRQGSVLLGLYEGVPETKWGKGFGGNLPDKITIFQESIERFAKSAEEIKEMVKNVVWHEIAHHFGIDENEVRKLEIKWKNKK
ncbi:MAG: metallopeptidase family protein [Candidatus Pacebacteria bacterium]|nr:metallopeptidase family protein [Candidatus Paceibacterota bacterium]